MTSRRIQSKAFVKERKKNDPRYGEVVSESGWKAWNIKFFPNEETATKKSGQ